MHRAQRIAAHLSPESGPQMAECAAAASASPTETGGALAADAIVVGAGAIGCPLAVALAKQGRRVLVFERDMREPDRIVGELVQPGGVEILKKLGMESVLDGIDAVKENGYCVVNKGKVVHLPYPKGYYGASFHHGRLIMNLRKHMQATPGVQVKQATVTSLIEEGGVVHGVKYNEGNTTGEARAPLTFVVDGCFSRFRSALGGAQPVAQSSFVGLVLKMPVEKMIYPCHGHVILCDPSPVLFYALTPTEIRVLVDVPHPLPSAGDGSLKRHMLEHVLPQLPVEFRDAFRRALDEDRLRSMPNNYMSAQQTRKPGVVLLGDSFNMRHPLTGGGMTVGWSDAYLLTEQLRGVDLRSRTAVAAALREFERVRAPAAATINILSMALYHVFSGSGDKGMPAMREACFAYFECGGICASGPIKLLAGLTPNYWVLFAHFFAVALYGMGRLLLPVPRPTRVSLAARVLIGATKIIAPLIAQERVTFLKYWPFRDALMYTGPYKKPGAGAAAASTAAVAAAAASSSSASRSPAVTVPKE